MSRLFSIVLKEILSTATRRERTRHTESFLVLRNDAKAAQLLRDHFSLEGDQVSCSVCVCVAGVAGGTSDSKWKHFSGHMNR